MLFISNFKVKLVCLSLLLKWLLFLHKGRSWIVSHHRCKLGPLILWLLHCVMIHWLAIYVCQAISFQRLMDKLCDKRVLLQLVFFLHRLDLAFNFLVDRPNSSIILDHFRIDKGCERNFDRSCHWVYIDFAFRLHASENIRAFSRLDFSLWQIVICPVLDFCKLSKGLRWWHIARKSLILMDLRQLS